LSISGVSLSINTFPGFILQLSKNNNNKNKKFKKSFEIRWGKSRNVLWEYSKSGHIVEGLGGKSGTKAQELWHYKGILVAYDIVRVNKRNTSSEMEYCVHCFA
jgi:hypothetical protein